MNTAMQNDSVDREVDFGPAYSYEQFFDPTHLHHIPLPSSPPRSACYDIGERCGCESCRTEGWYTLSPLCRFWRAGCEACGGSRRCRVYDAPGTWYEEFCELCEHTWRDEVASFRLALADRSRQLTVGDPSRADDRSGGAPGAA